jgi:hypothetical protein
MAERVVADREHWVIEIPVKFRKPDGRTIEHTVEVRVLAFTPIEAVERLSIELQRCIRREWTI